MIIFTKNQVSTYDYGWMRSPGMKYPLSGELLCGYFLVGINDIYDVTNGDFKVFETIREYCEKI